MAMEQKIPAYFDKRRKMWRVDLAETILEPTQVEAERVARLTLAFYAEAKGFDSPIRELISQLKGDKKQLQAENKRLKEALESMCRQFGYWSNGVGGYWTGGLSVLEDAFEILGWTGPQPCPEACCQKDDCKERATCGTPTSSGYKHLCSKHRQALKDSR